MTDPTIAPAPASHDPRVPTGLLEESAAALFDAMLAARDAEATGDDAALRAFYRTLLTSTLLLPVPPGSQQDAERSLASAASDQQEVEIGVMLARDGEGNAVSVVFGSGAALAAWSPTGSGNIALPARVVMQNLAAADLPAIFDPAGPVPYRFERDELAALAAGVYPGTQEPIFPDRGGTSVRFRLPGPEADEIERVAREVLAETQVAEAYLVETGGAAARTIVMGVVGHLPAEETFARVTAAATRADLGFEVRLLDEATQSQMSQLAPPFHRKRR